MSKYRFAGHSASARWGRNTVARQRPSAFRSGLAAALILAGAACDPGFTRRFQQALFEEVVFGEYGSCGPIELAVLVPDCPVPGVCFTPACDNHNECYGICGVNKRECDEQFFRDLVAVCSRGLPLTDPLYSHCRYVAITYWTAVVAVGDAAFAATQEGVCGLPPDDGQADQMGSCCSVNAATTCRNGEFLDCPPGDLFIPEFSCEDIETLFGGCPIPPNDECAAAIQVCAGAAADADLGRCAGEPDKDRGGAVCSISSQDCVNGLACLPFDGDVYRCRVNTDNRLATTDGPPAAGDCAASGALSFQADVWYTLSAPCDGTLTIRMCDAMTYDAMLAVYASEGGVSGESGCACPADNESLLACNDDFCGFAATVSGVTIEDVIEGGCYLLRVGGWSADGTPATTHRGVSRLDIGFFCDNDMTLLEDSDDEQNGSLIEEELPAARRRSR